MDDVHSQQYSETNSFLTKDLTDLLADAINLATFAVENGRLPESVSFSELYRMWEKKVENGARLSEADVDNLQYYYQILEAELSPVSAISLRATDETQSRKGNRKKIAKHKGYLNNDAGRHAKRMWYMAFAILGLMIAINLYRYMFDMNAGDWAQNYTESFTDLTLVYWLAGMITPFAYGAFGATVRLLRITEQRLRERSFDPRRLAEHLNRLVLGTLSGGVIVLIYSTGGVGDTDVKLTEAALGFLAGYSVDLMFSLLDRLVKAISPDAEKSEKIIQFEKKSIKAPEESFAKSEIDKAASVVNASIKQSEIDMDNNSEKKQDAIKQNIMKSKVKLTGAVKEI